MEQDDSDLFDEPSEFSDDPNSPAGAIEDEIQLQALLREIGRRAEAGAPAGEQTSLERWIRVPVTDAITLSVRNISEEDAGLVEQLAELLARIGRS